MKVEARHTFSIYLPTSLYQKLLDKAGKGKISTFIKEVLEEKLEKEEQNQKRDESVEKPRLDLLEKNEVKTKRPSMWKIVFYNDD